jgi:hypothetical protein
MAATLPSVEPLSTTMMCRSTAMLEASDARQDRVAWRPFQLTTTATTEGSDMGLTLAASRHPGQQLGLVAGHGRGPVKGGLNVTSSG